MPKRSLSAGRMGIIRKAPFISVFARKAPVPSCCMYSIAMSNVSYFTEACSFKMLWFTDISFGWLRSWMRRNLSFSFLGRNDNGDICMLSKGFFSNGPANLFLSSSSFSNAVTISGCSVADLWLFEPVVHWLALAEGFSWHSMLNPLVNPLIR